MSEFDLVPASYRRARRLQRGSRWVAASYAVALAPDGERRARIARAVEEVGAVASGARPSPRGVGAVTVRTRKG